MIVSVIHENGQVYNLPVSQVVVRGDDGQPLAVSYEQEPGLVHHCDATHSDFDKVCKNLRLEAPRVDKIAAKPELKG